MVVAVVAERLRSRRALVQAFVRLGPREVCESPRRSPAGKPCFEVVNSNENVPGLAHHVRWRTKILKAVESGSEGRVVEVGCA